LIFFTRLHHSAPPHMTPGRNDLPAALGTGALEIFQLALGDHQFVRLPAFASNRHADQPRHPQSRTWSAPFCVSKFSIEGMPLRFSIGIFCDRHIRRDRDGLRSRLFQPRKWNGTFHRASRKTTDTSARVAGRVSIPIDRYIPVGRRRQVAHKIVGEILRRHQRRPLRRFVLMVPAFLAAAAAARTANLSSRGVASGERLTGREANHSSTSVSVQARVFGPSNLPGGKFWVRIIR
jgi:hypothetical protein